MSVHSGRSHKAIQFFTLTLVLLVAACGKLKNNTSSVDGTTSGSTTGSTSGTTTGGSDTCSSATASLQALNLSGGSAHVNQAITFQVTASGCSSFELDTGDGSTPTAFTGTIQFSVTYPSTASNQIVSVTVLALDASGNVVKHLSLTSSSFNVVTCNSGCGTTSGSSTGGTSGTSTGSGTTGSTTGSSTGSSTGTWPIPTWPFPGPTNPTPNPITPPPPPPPQPKRVGINFEDWYDWDFNDTVACIDNGYFNLEGSRVVSYASQTVTASFSKISACDSYVDLKVLDDNGVTRTHYFFNSSQSPSYSLQFLFGWELKVSIYPLGACERYVWITQDDFVRARVGNYCNLTGN